MRSISLGHWTTILASTAMSLVATTSHAQQYSMSTLNVPAPRQFDVGVQLNDAGWAVGVTSIPDDRPVLWRDGAAITLDMAGGSYGWARAINNAGQIVGATSVPGTNTWRATLWDGTTATLLPTFHGNLGIATSINDGGQIVGWSGTTGSDSNGARAIMWDGSLVIDLGPGIARDINNAGQVLLSTSVGFGALWNGTNTTLLPGLDPMAIDDAGTVVGYYTEGGWLPHAMRWSEGTTESLLGVSGYQITTIANDINNRGQAVGMSSSIAALVGMIPNESVATLWNGTTGIDLNTLVTGADALYVTLLSAQAINDPGQILAIGIDSRAPGWRAYLLTPVPLPAAFWLLLTALGPLGLLARRRSSM